MRSCSLPWPASDRLARCFSFALASQVLDVDERRLLEYEDRAWTGSVLKGGSSHSQSFICECGPCHTYLFFALFCNGSSLLHDLLQRLVLLAPPAWHIIQKSEYVIICVQCQYVFPIFPHKWGPQLSPCFQNSLIPRCKVGTATGVPASAGYISTSWIFGRNGIAIAKKGPNHPICSLGPKYHPYPLILSTYKMKVCASQSSQETQFWALPRHIAAPDTGAAWTSWVSCRSCISKLVMSS